MSKELNIAEILKDKPQGTKLYSPICGELVLVKVTPNGIFCRQKITDDNSNNVVFMDDGHFKNYGNFEDAGECLLFPSKIMRDWEKFAWRQGDVLADNHNTNCMFDGWSEDDYTQFNTAYSISTDTSDKKHFYEDEIFNAEDFYKIGAYGQNDFIADLEKEYKGKFNPETLEIEKPKQEFKDGDIVYVETKDDYKIVSIFKKFSEQKKPLVYAEHFLGDSGVILTNKFDKYNILCDKEEIREIRLATEEEKELLFSKLEKTGKKWDSENLKIVDLPKGYTFKPFERVLIRDYNDEEWCASFFSHYADEGKFQVVCINGCDVQQCIPYEGNEELLGTSNKPKEGGKE